MVTVFGFGILVFLIACSASNSSASSSGNAGAAQTEIKKIVAKVGHPNAGQEFDQYQYFLVEMNKKLEELSNNTVGLEIYPDGVLGSERDMFDSVKMGVQDMVFGSTVPISSSVPQLQIFDMPFLFDTVDEYRKLISDDRGTFDEVRTILLNDFNMKNIIFADGGFRRLMGKDTPMTSIDRIKGRKVRITDNRITSRIYILLGAIPTNVAWSEMFTAHQQGTVDAAEWPLFSAHSAGFAEVTDWYAFSDIYAMILYLNINKNLWDGFTPEQQQWFQDAAVYARAEQFKMIDEKSEEFLKEFEAAKCKVYRDVDKKALKDATAVMWKEFRDEIGGNFIDGVRARLEEIRAGK
jgi:TRAP-type C4-dicarboxylate transport system substrate-binding protein